MASITSKSPKIRVGIADKKRTFVQSCTAQRANEVAFSICHALVALLEFKVAEHSFQVLMPYSPLLLNYL